jgi:carboxyl-terminal processing protease
VPYAFVMPGNVGYVRLSSYGAHAGEELAAALDTLRTGGARALVLDLRGNPGGLVEQAVAVVQQLVPEGSLVVYTKGRLPSAARRWVAGKARTQLVWPVAVLVDGGSASAAEITAGALQDLDRALVVGRASFGKGTVQDVFPLRNHEGALKLTTAYYFTPSGRSLQRVRPPEPALDDDADELPADSAVTDSAAVPGGAPKLFHTASGRVVHGGGVEPDLVVAPDSLPPLALALETHRIAFRFAARRPAEGADAWSAYREFARAQGVAGSDADFERERVPIARGLERERARRTGGAAAAAKLALADDAVYRRAAEVVGRAKSARDVFAIALGRPVPVPGTAGKVR